MLRLLALLAIGCACAAPAENAKTAAVQPRKADSDLNTDASSYYDRYDYGARSYPTSGYATGGYGTGGYGLGVTGYGTVEDPRYNSVGGYDNYGYDRGNPASYAGGAGGYAGYDRGGYGATNGGYGGYGGNGGWNSYYGYNNPNYQGSYHLGYGYYNRRPGYGNIYSSGITPSLVTGYRGYSRK